MIRAILIILFLSGLVAFSHAQNDTICYKIKIVNKNKKFKDRTKSMNTFSPKGFYLYNNYCYKLVFKDQKDIFGRIIRIEDDSIHFTNSFNANIARNNDIKYDTLTYSIKDIKLLRLITEDINGYSRDIDMSEYILQIEPEDCCNEVSKVESLDGNTLYDCYPFLTNNGIAFIYEKEGKLLVMGSRE